MKIIYTSLMALASLVASAQQVISFESAEGFQLGTIHQQNGWTVTESSDGFVTNQLITSEQASEGTHSFKNANEPAYGPQWFPIFGAVQSFDTPVSHTNFTISYDVLATAKLGADFEFTLFAIDENEEYVPVAGVGIENRGFIYLIKDVNYGFDYAVPEWTPNQWTNIKIEVSATEIKYYINNTLEHAITNFTNLDIAGFNMLHNNYGADAYYDNVVITTGSLGNNDFQNSKLTVFPIPADTTLSLSMPPGIDLTEVAIFDLMGRNVLSSVNDQIIDVSNLASGSYILKAKGSDGSSFTKKIIRK